MSTSSSNQNPLCSDAAFPRPRVVPLAGFRAVLSRARALFAGCGLFEWLTFAYLAALNLLIVVFRHNLPAASLYFAAHACLATAVVVLCGASARWPSPASRFLRHWYPMLLFLGFFEELHYLVHMVFPGWFDRWLIQSDFALFGVHPTVWFEQFASPALNDFMQFFYMSYYFYGLILGAILFARRPARRGGEQHSFWHLMTATAAAYYLGYLISILFPIEGPYHTLAGLQRVELTGGPVTSLMGFIESWGRVHGAAFPSAHVSGSFVAVLGAWRYRRRLFWVFLPFFLAMLLATVYGRYHYVADVLAGLLVGAIGWSLADLLQRRADVSSTS